MTLKQCHILKQEIRGKNDFTERSKILDTDLKIILLKPEQCKKC